MGPHSEGWPSWAFSNHDAPRCVSRWYDGPDRPRFAKLTNALLFCLRGNPILYQGEELGLTQVDVPFEALQDPEAIANWPRTLGRDGARTPMAWSPEAPYAGFSTAQPWLPVGDDHPDLSVDVQTGDLTSVLAFTQRFLGLRSASKALRLGDVRFVDAADDLLILIRSHQEETVMCLFNLGGEPATLPDEVDLAGDVLIESGWGANVSGRTVPPYSVAILRR